MNEHKTFAQLSLFLYINSLTEDGITVQACNSKAVVQTASSLIEATLTSVSFGNCGDRSLILAINGVCLESLSCW
jgi:hypothetical protein